MNFLTAKIVVTLCTGSPVRIWITHEALPLVGEESPDLLWGKPVPHARVNLRHLRFLNNFYSRAGHGFDGGGGEKRPGGMMRPPPGGRPYLTHNEYFAPCRKQAATYDQSAICSVNTALLE